MESIKIILNQSKEKINEVILAYPFDAKTKCKNKTVKDSEILIFNIDREKVDEELIYDSLVKFILHLTLELYMKELINIKVTIILQDYFESDISEVENTVLDLLSDEDYFIDDKKEIYDEIKEYISENDTLNIEGYLRFRSRSFENLVDKVIEKVIMDIQMETEYEDFIEMLRYYINSQIPKVDTVNVVIKNDEYFLYDHKHRKIEDSSLDSIEEGYRLDDLSKSDMLVSSLIVLAPSKVIVHIKNDNQRELMQILKKIFAARLNFCYSCNLCDSMVANKDIE